MTGPVILGRTQAKAMGYIQFPQIQWPHTLTAFPNASRKLCTHRTPTPKTILYSQAHISKKTQPQVSLHKTKLIEITQAKQAQQATEPVLPHIKWNTDSIELNGKTHKLPITKEYILKEYHDVFKGVGTLPGGPYHIRLKEQYKPVQHPPRSVPVAMQTTYKAELDRLTKEGIITEVREHTEWIKHSFKGVGTLPGGPYHIRLKEQYKPVQHPPRSVPVAMQTTYKAELDRLTKEGIITEVKEHTEWINSIVPVMKPNGSLRLCLDPKDLNKAIERNQWYSRTIDDILPELAKSKFKTLKDATSGYWHVVLDLASSLLTTFNTPWGKFRWLRLPFGLKIASDVFQEQLDRVLRLLEGVHGIADDILTHGETEAQHSGRLLTLLKTARMNNLSLNPDKIQFKSTDCKFFGHRLAPEGLKPDPEKIKAILSMQPPQSIQQLQSFNGMVNYLKRFSPVLSELAEPLRKLQKSDTVWAWESEQQTAFEKTKTALTTLPVLAYFNKSKEHIIQTDASKTGLSAVLLQEGQPVVYASRSLTETECRYSNIERELLGVVFGLERLHHYTFGKPITVETDHQPLTSIWKKTIATSSPRLQRLLLRLAQYDVHIEYLKGKENVIADALSRITSLKSEHKDYSDSLSNIEKIPVHQITQTAPASPERLQELREATDKDPSLRLLAKIVHEGWPKTIKDCPRSIQSYWYFRDQITCEDGIIYKGTRLIMPKSERASTLKVLHMGHCAIDKMSLRARETVYWPGINKDIRSTYHQCHICAKFARTQQKETLQSIETPQTTWEQLGLDIFSLRNTQYLLVIDYFSRFPVVKQLQILHSLSVIKHLKDIFT